MTNDITFRDFAMKAFAIKKPINKITKRINPTASTRRICQNNKKKAKIKLLKSVTNNKFEQNFIVNCSACIQMQVTYY